MSPRVRAALKVLVKALEDDERERAEEPERPPRVDELAQAKARKALERHGLRKVATKR